MIVNFHKENRTPGKVEPYNPFQGRSIKKNPDHTALALSVSSIALKS